MRHYDLPKRSLSAYHYLSGMIIRREAKMRINRGRWQVKLGQAIVTQLMKMKQFAITASTDVF
jgi:hypothetical protein